MRLTDLEAKLENLLLRQDRLCELQNRLGKRQDDLHQMLSGLLDHQKDIYNLQRIFLDMAGVMNRAGNLVLQKYADEGLIDEPSGKLVSREDYEAAAPLAPPEPPPDQKPS